MSEFREARAVGWITGDAPVTFRTLGKPVPQGSKVPFGRVLIEQGGQRLKDWREAIRSDAVAALAGRAPWDGPLYVRVDFYFPRPKAHYRTGRNAGQLRLDAPVGMFTRPDVDKLSRAVLDALTMAGVWHDDAQVATLTASKWYTETAPQTHVVVRRSPANLLGTEW